MAGKKKSYGKTAGGKPITDELIAGVVEKAEEGFDVDGIVRRGPGRPALGSAPARVESVRLDPETRTALLRRAAQDHESTSAVIRSALRSYLETS